MARSQESIGLKIEKFGPMAISLIAFALMLYFSKEISGRFASHAWRSSGLYSAIFGWSAIQSGFAFGVYGFVLGKSGGFVASLKGTQTMARFEGYIKRAIWTGFLLTFVTIPLIVCEPVASQPLNKTYVIISAWFAFFIWAFLAFLRLAYNFGALAAVKDKDFNGA